MGGLTGVISGIPTVTGTFPITVTVRFWSPPASVSSATITTGFTAVCPSTDPGWTPLFVNARGLIVERGGVLSHGAIVARDFGIPAVVLEGATRLIPDGALLELDANHGTILVLPRDRT